MRFLAAPCLLLLFACEVGPDESNTAVSRAALSVPVRVITLDGGGFAPRNLIPQRILPFDAGALIIADEPWFSDGSGQPATFLGDFTPGPIGTASFNTSRGEALFNGQVLFVARNPVQRQFSLWSTDGTFAGTQPASPSTTRVLGINSVAPFGLTLRVRRTREWLATYRGPTEDPEPFFELPSSSQPPLADFVSTTHGALFLYQTNTRLELLRTDGTDAGTSSLTASRLALRDLGGPLVPFGGSAYFRTTGSEARLWRSDGSDAGPDSTSFSIRDVVAMGSTAQALVVLGEQAGNNAGPAVIFTDGTDAGTRIVLSESNGSFLTQPQLEGTTQTHAFVQARLTSGDFALFGCDGTDAGTEQLTTFPLPATPANNRLATRTRFYFTDQQGHPWASDGTSAGTVQLSASALNARNFAALDDARVVFYAAQNSTGVEPWVSDGTPAGTNELADLAPGQASSVNLFNVSPVAAGGRAWFPCQTPVHGIQTCVTDGTPAGTRVATPTLGPVPSTPVSWLARAGTRLLIGQGGAVLGSDGTQAGSELLPMRALATSRPVSAPNGGAWLLGPHPSAIAEVWYTDGTASGSVRITTDAGLPFLPTLHAANDRVFLKSYSPDAGDFLMAWSPDAGFTELPDFTPAPGDSTLMRDLQVIGDELYFLGSIPDAGTAIIASDGTAAGTRVLADASPIVETNSTGLVHFGGKFYFRSYQQNGFSLARFDPTSGAGVEFILPNLNVNFRGRFVVARNNLILFSGSEVYRVDPVSLATETLLPSGVALLGEIKPWGDGVVFTVQDAAQGEYTVWATDGTIAGTRALTGVIETLGNETPTISNAYGDEGGDFFISTWTRETGLEPGALAVNGSTITPLADLWPGPHSSNPSMPVRIGDALYFVADDGQGVGVFKIDATVITPTGGGNGGSGGGAATGGGAAAGGGSGGGGGEGGGAAGGAGAGQGGGEGGGDGSAQPGCGCTAVEPSGLLLALLAARWRARRGSRERSSR